MIQKELLKNNNLDFLIKKDLIPHPMNMKTPHHHEHYEILYLSESKRNLYVNNQLYIMNNSNIALLPPGLSHRTESPENKYQERILINFKPSFIENFSSPLGIDILSCFDASAPVKTCSPKQLSQILDIADKLKLAQNDYNIPMLQLLLCQFLLECSTLKPASHFDIDTHDNVFHDIIQYIDQHYNEEITLDILSKKFNTDKYQISRKFKDFCGYSFVKYLNKTRIENAENLLNTTTMSVSEIAQTTGYNNVQHFTYVFKKKNNISPDKYRNNKNTSA